LERKDKLHEKTRSLNAKCCVDSWFLILYEAVSA
jgi:hypothetical protein